MIRIVLSGMCVVILVLAGCEKTKVGPDDQAPHAADSHAPADIDPEEVVWADQAFLEGAGVKPGKDVIYLPTPPMVADKMVELANIKSTDLVYDLGTGDGRIAIAAAKKTGCKAIGFEIDPELVALARENVRESGLGHLVTIEQKDILDLDFSTVDVVLMYLDGDLNVALLPQLAKLKPGARVVSHDWGMGGMIEQEVVIEKFQSKVPDFVNLHTIYMWTAPFRYTDAAESQSSH